MGEDHTSVEDTVAFYAGTGIDMISVSLGSIHGALTTKSVLQYDLMKDLRAAVSCRLVMHGASGMTEAEYTQSVQSGITKLNFASYMQLV